MTKIQAEKELAEEDAIQAQQPEMEEETLKPTPWGSSLSSISLW